ncbi:MAG: hypothetical protein JWQ35_2731 [Bacteriovoracaceae bacterium]|nr:hypothetical protein [Bacteriovoracaceae bacterium]
MSAPVKKLILRLIFHFVFVSVLPLIATGAPLCPTLLSKILKEKEISSLPPINDQGIDRNIEKEKYLREIFAEVLELNKKLENAISASEKFLARYSLNNLFGLSSSVYALTDVEFPIVKDPEEYKEWLLNREIRKAAWDVSPYFKLERIFLNHDISNDLDIQLRSATIAAARERILNSVNGSLPQAAPGYLDPIWGWMRTLGINDASKIEEFATMTTDPYGKHFFFRLARRARALDPQNQKGLRKFAVRYLGYDPMRLPQNSKLRLDFSELMNRFSEDSYQNAEQIYAEINLKRDFLILEDFESLVQESIKRGRLNLALHLAVKTGCNVSAQNISVLSRNLKKQFSTIRATQFSGDELIFFAGYAPLSEAVEVITSVRNQFGFSESLGSLDRAILIIKDRTDGGYANRLPL